MIINMRCSAFSGNPSAEFRLQTVQPQSVWAAIKLWISGPVKPTAWAAALLQASARAMPLINSYKCLLSGAVNLMHA